MRLVPTVASASAVSNKAHADRAALLAQQAAKGDKVARAETALDGLYDEMAMLAEKINAAN